LVRRFKPGSCECFHYNLTRRIEQIGRLPDLAGPPFPERGVTSCDDFPYGDLIGQRTITEIVAMPTVAETGYWKERLDN